MEYKTESYLYVTALRTKVSKGSINNVNKILSVSLGDFHTLSPDEIVQPIIFLDQQIGIISNVAKSTGDIEIRIVYI